MAPVPPWSDLPLDVLLQLFSPLEFPDLIRVSAVCSSFNSAVSSSPRLLEWRKSPWLLFLSETKEVVYYNLSEKQVRKIPLKEPLSTWHVIDFSHGWLIIADLESNLHLFNPLTRQQIRLPPLTKMDGVNPIFDDEENIIGYETSFDEEINAFEMHEQFFKIVLSRDPVEGEYMVVLVQVPRIQPDNYTVEQISFVRGGDERWTTLEKESIYDDLIFHDGLLYGLTEIGGVDVWDFAGDPEPSLKVIVPEDTICDVDDGYEVAEIILMDKYILLMPCGEILVVRRESSEVFEGKFKKWTEKLSVYKIWNGKLVEINSLEDYAIFVGKNSGCFSTKNFSNLRDNSIYFMEYVQSGGFRLAVYDLTKKYWQFEDSLEHACGILEHACGMWIRTNL